MLYFAYRNHGEIYMLHAADSRIDNLTCPEKRQFNTADERDQFIEEEREYCKRRGGPERLYAWEIKERMDPTYEQYLVDYYRRDERSMD